MPARTEEVISRLNQLIEACKDREQGYRTAADSACNHDLKTLLRSYEKQSAGYVAQLQAEVKRLGGVPAETGSLVGLLARNWQHLALVVNGGGDRALIAACERGEDAARAGYEKVLAELLPNEVRAVLEQQYAGVKASHDRLRALAAVAVGTA
jgi:uncharacterized protein (TIGR02284 family)